MPWGPSPQYLQGCWCVFLSVFALWVSDAFRSTGSEHGRRQGKYSAERGFFFLMQTFFFFFLGRSGSLEG